MEQGGNINLALWLAQSGMGPSIVGDPTAVYGGIMTYRAALEAVGSGIRLGPSQAWKLDREVYVYLFEGEFTDSMTGTELVTDWAQKFVMFDAETGESYSETTSREPARRDVSQLQPIRILDHVKGVAPREVAIDRRSTGGGTAGHGRAAPSRRRVTIACPSLLPNQCRIDANEK